MFFESKLFKTTGLLIFSAVLVVSGCARKSKSKVKLEGATVVCPAVKETLSCIRYGKPCPQHFENVGFDVIEATEKNTEFTRSSWSAANRKVACLYTVTKEDGSRDYASIAYTGKIQQPDFKEGEGDWHRGNVCEGAQDDCPFYPKHR